MLSRLYEGCEGQAFDIRQTAHWMSPPSGLAEQQLPRRVQPQQASGCPAPLALPALLPLPRLGLEPSPASPSPSPLSARETMQVSNTAAQRMAGDMPRPAAAPGSCVDPTGHPPTRRPPTFATRPCPRRVRQDAADAVVHLSIRPWRGGMGRQAGPVRGTPAAACGRASSDASLLPAPRLPPNPRTSLRVGRLSYIDSSGMKSTNDVGVRWACVVKARHNVRCSSRGRWPGGAQPVRLSQRESPTQAAPKPAAPAPCLRRRSPVSVDEAR